MNYLVVGAGNASRPVARLLNHLGHDVVVTDLKDRGCTDIEITKDIEKVVAERIRRYNSGQINVR